MNETLHDFTITPQWLLAGHAIFTVSNGQGTHYTFRIAKVEGGDLRPDVWFVSLLTSPDHYTYLGMLSWLTNNGAPGVKLTKASKYVEDSTPVKVVRWAIGIVYGVNKLPEGYSISGEGRCGRCGRALTHPDGINNDGYRLGFGPVCWNIINGGAE